MSTKPETNKLRLQRYLDNSLSVSEKEAFEYVLENDEDLTLELSQLTDIRDGIQRDTDEIVQAQDFERFNNALFERAEAEGLLTPKSMLAAAGWLTRLKEEFHWTWLVPATGIALVMSVLLLWPAPTVMDNPALPMSGQRADSNDCIVDSLETVDSATVVFETERVDDKEDPVTVIWVFEKSDGKDPG
jgi:hypothetical protein